MEEKDAILLLIDSVVAKHTIKEVMGPESWLSDPVEVLRELLFQIVPGLINHVQLTDLELHGATMSSIVMWIFLTSIPRLFPGARMFS